MGEGEHGSLQFEKAEFDSGAETASACTRCARPLGQTYFTVDGAATCRACRNEVATEGTGGTGPGRFARACVFGGLAGAVGAAIWYGIREATGYEVGLISILVGIMVGVAVRIGSRGRGGLLYQALAVFIAYSAIVSTYVPMILTELGKMSEAEAGQEVATGEATPDAPLEAPADGQPASPPEAEPATAAEQVNLEAVSPGMAALGLLVVAVVVVVLAYAAPFLGGLENIIGLAIIAFGLWEAWRINRRQEHAIEGPFQVGEQPAEPAGSGAVPGV